MDVNEELARILLEDVRKYGLVDENGLMWLDGVLIGRVKCFLPL